ncbi:MAG: tRNA (guanine(10)-N(2))-dimethyltransferase [Methanotrichaceae archaeon]|nr:tRNA (guanine(10)-N(2))-dimethyltransferase [Methanotrichaceae archaeon]
MNYLREGAISFEAQNVFYNPTMKLNRDICVASVKSLGIYDYLDALSASGIRGLRVAKEVGIEKVVLNDISPQAYQCIKRNIVLNGLTNCLAICCNANALMHKRHFQAVDLDPFGSPSPFIAAAARSALAYLMITATDTAPLCGAHFNSGRRKYLANPVKTDYHKEMGARILLGLTARELARQDKAMFPLLTYAVEHYVRICLGIKRSAKLADESLDKLGYVEHCRVCGSFNILKETSPKGKCIGCSSATVLAGPLWLGNIQERDFINQCLKHLKGMERATRLLETCASEDEVPFYYDHHSICDRLGLTPSKIDRVMDLLRESGWKVTRTHFAGLGIKTDAAINDVEAAIKAASLNHNS